MPASCHFVPAVRLAGSDRLCRQDTLRDCSRHVSSWSLRRRRRRSVDSILEGKAAYEATGNPIQTASVISRSRQRSLSAQALMAI